MKSFTVIFLTGFLISKISNAAETVPLADAPKKNIVTNQASIKLELALQLLLAEGLVKDFQQNIDHASNDLATQSINKNKKISPSVYAETKKQFDAGKELFKKQSLEKVALFLANKFSEAELKYLIDLSNNSLNKKFKSVLAQDDFHLLMDAPYIKAYELLKIN